MNANIYIIVRESKNSDRRIVKTNIAAATTLEDAIAYLQNLAGEWKGEFVEDGEQTFVRMNKNDYFRIQIVKMV